MDYIFATITGIIGDIPLAVGIAADYSVLSWH